MKVEYDIKNNYIKYYNEANGIVALKEKLKKNPNKKVRGYLSYITLNFLVYFIIYFILNILCVNLETVSRFVLYLTLFIVGVYFFMIGLFFITALNNKIHSMSGTIEIGEEGISDKTDNGIKITVPYEQIELVVITNDLIVFVTKTPIVLFINNKNKDEIINEIKKYSEVQILIKTNKL